MNRFILLLGLISLLFLASLSLAEIPKLINYQGMLTDDEGDPIEDEEYDITFTIYNDSTSTSSADSLWGETHVNVSVNNGLFNVILGRVNPIDLDFYQEDEYWLDISVEGEHFSRLRFISVAYAFRAQMADSARVAIPGSGSHWSVTDSVLCTNRYWGIARGDAGNVLYGDSAHTMVNFGVGCTTGTSGQNYEYCTVGGGYKNTASWLSATVGGGSDNTASRTGATVGGGYDNTASGSHATVGGGFINTASGDEATIGGGGGNTASELLATVGGGNGNIASGYCATVGGGYGNTASGYNATVGGGRLNTASGVHSFAAGLRAKANHNGTFVWADSTGADFASTGPNQFLIRASGGVGIGTTSPNSTLHVDGSLALAYKYVNTVYTLTDSDCIVGVDVTGSKKDITLPSAVGKTGRVYTIKVVAGGQWVALWTSSSQKIDDYTSGFIHLGLWQYVTVVSNGSNWLIIGKNF